MLNVQSKIARSLVIREFSADLWSSRTLLEATEEASIVRSRVSGRGRQVDKMHEGVRAWREIFEMEQPRRG
jgi:hypothetical protein